MIELLVPPARLSGLLPQFIGAADNFDSKRPSHCRCFRIPEHNSTQKSAFRIRQVHLHQCQLGSTVPDNKFVQSRPPHKLFRIELLISSSAAPEFALPPGEAPSSSPAGGASPFEANGPLRLPTAVVLPSLRARQGVRRAALRGDAQLMGTPSSRQRRYGRNFLPATTGSARDAGDRAGSQHSCGAEIPCKADSDHPLGSCYLQYRRRFT